MSPATTVHWDATLDEAPCDLCPQRARCRTGDACPAFQSFVQHGGRRWRNEARVPDGGSGLARVFRDGAVPNVLIRTFRRGHHLEQLSTAPSLLAIQTSPLRPRRTCDYQRGCAFRCRISSITAVNGMRRRDKTPPA